MLSWLPTARDFRGELRAVLDSPNPGDCLEKLASLAAYRLGFLETVQLERALGRLGLEEEQGIVRNIMILRTSWRVDERQGNGGLLGTWSRRPSLSDNQLNYSLRRKGGVFRAFNSVPATVGSVETSSRVVFGLHATCDLPLPRAPDGAILAPQPLGIRRMSDTTIFGSC
jgi:hypothetical protein